MAIEVNAQQPAPPVPVPQQTVSAASAATAIESLESTLFSLRGGTQDPNVKASKDLEGKKLNILQRLSQRYTKVHSGQQLLDGVKVFTVAHAAHLALSDKDADDQSVVMLGAANELKVTKKTAYLTCPFQLPSSAAQFCALLDNWIELLSTSYGHSIFGSESAALKEAADLTKFKRICMQTFQRAAQHTATRTLETKIRSFTFQLFAIRFYASGGQVFPDSELAVSQFWSLMDVLIQSPFTGSRMRLGKSDITPNINEVKDFNSHGIFCCAHGSVTDAASCGLTTAQCK